MCCELCRAYLHDYFQQPLEKENPLRPLVNEKRLRQTIPQLSDLVLRFLFRSVTPHLLYTTKSDMDNYFTFLVKPTDPYQMHEMYFRFLKRNGKVAQEVKGMQAEILAYDFLRIKRNDRYETVVEKWLGFLIGSLLIELYELHVDHSKPNLMTLNVDKGMPGFPKRKKIQKEIKDTQCVPPRRDEEDDDLYS